MVPGIHHVQIAIPAGGEGAARTFYGELLGLSEIEKPKNLQGRGGLWFDTATLQLHLGVDPEFLPAHKAHVAFHVPDLPDTRRRLEAEGYTIAEEEPLPGFNRLYVADPFGNRTELIEPV
jgi:catechol 2,3-dioxygenase-like lactoylglutathione lyase family enzyme